MSKAPYVPFYTSDFLGGTSGMTAATKGVYITLLCLMYEEEGPLPQKWDTLARRCGCTLPAFTKAIQDLVDDGKVSVLGGGLWSEKCEKHITQRCERRDSAKSAAEKRWKKDKQNQSIPDADAMPEACQPEPEPDKIRVLKHSCAPDGFEDFWSQYPHRGGAKKGKPAALKAWAKARASPDAIIQGAMRYATDRQVLSGYAKDPATWLNAKGWEDDIEGTNDRQYSGVRENRIDPALANIARLTGLDRASGNGGG